MKNNIKNKETWKHNHARLVKLSKLVLIIIWIYVQLIKSFFFLRFNALVHKGMDGSIVGDSKIQSSWLVSLFGDRTRLRLKRSLISNIFFFVFFLQKEFLSFISFVNKNKFTTTKKQTFSNAYINIYGRFFLKYILIIQSHQQKKHTYKQNTYAFVHFIDA